MTRYKLLKLQFVLCHLNPDFYISAFSKCYETRKTRGKRRIRKEVREFDFPVSFDVSILPSFRFCKLLSFVLEILTWLSTAPSPEHLPPSEELRAICLYVLPPYRDHIALYGCFQQIRSPELRLFVENKTVSGIRDCTCRRASRTALHWLGMLIPARLSGVANVSTTHSIYILHPIDVTARVTWMS